MTRAEDKEAQERGKWGWAREFTRTSPSSVTLLLVVALILYFGDRAIDKMVVPLNALRETITETFGPLEKSLALFAETQRTAMEAREIEHQRMADQLEQCVEMGHALRDCQMNRKR